MWKAIHVWGQGIYGISVVSAQFCCESKTALKLKCVKITDREKIIATYSMNDLFPKYILKLL